MLGTQGHFKSLGGANIGHLIKTGWAEKLLLSVHGQLQVFTPKDVVKINDLFEIVPIVHFQII
jgi:hypothetical protein